MNRPALWLGLMLTAAAAIGQAQPDLDLAAAQITEQTNTLRRANGLPATAPDAALRAAALGMAQFMARTDRYGHEADGRQPVQRATAAGYDHCRVTENIAFQQRSDGFVTAQLAQTLVVGWQGSPPHRRNMLDAAVTHSGVALAHSAASGRFYAVQMFGRPGSLRLNFQIENQVPQSVTYELDGQQHTLGPRVWHEHQTCGPGRLQLLTPDQPSPPVGISESGRYVVQRRGNGPIGLQAR